MNGSVRLTMLALVVSLQLVACSGEERAGASAAALPAQVKAVTPAGSPTATTAVLKAGPVPVATLKELMDSTVDPAADGIWDAVAVRSTKKGVEHQQPRRPEEWAAVRRHAVTLIEAMNLVVLPGRHAAPPGTKPGLGELDPAQIDTAIASKRASFVSFATALQNTAQQALEAIDRHDVEGVVKTGGDIDAVCEGCHVTFWYPSQQ